MSQFTFSLASRVNKFDRLAFILRIFCVRIFKDVLHLSVIGMQDSGSHDLDSETDTSSRLFIFELIKSNINKG